MVPDEAHEAIRDLVQARQATVRALRQAHQQLSGFLLRHGRHRRWLSTLWFEHAVHHIVLEDCIAALRRRWHGATGWKPTSQRLAAVVHARQALRGMALVAAELGDITRFANPRQLMAYFGLVPSEHSSGGTRRQGGITKAGNGAARRMLIGFRHGSVASSYCGRRVWRS